MNTQGLHSARIVIEDLDVVDTFQILSGVEVPATVSFDISWHAHGPARVHQPGSDDPLDPTNFFGVLRDAVATGTFSGNSVVSATDSTPFSFEGEASTDFTWAEIGFEANGDFLANGAEDVSEIEQDLDVDSALRHLEPK